MQVRVPAVVREDEVYQMRFKRFGQVPAEQASTSSGTFAVERMKKPEL